jgi:hypothetical protein
MRRATRQASGFRLQAAGTKSVLLCCVAAVMLAAPALAVDTYNWTGALSSDFNSNGNWTTNGIAASSVPATADNVVIDYGSVDITASLNQSTKQFAYLVIGPNYTGQVGNSTSDYLRCGADLFVISGGGSDHFLSATGTGFTTAIVRSVGANGTDNLYLSGTIGTLDVRRATLHIASGCTITTMYVDPLNASSGNVTINSQGNVSNLYMRTGVLNVTAGTTGTANIDGGTVTISAGVFTNLSQRGGTLYWHTTSTLVDAEIFGGTFDASGDVRAKTITAIRVHNGAAITLDNAIGNVEVTDGVQVFAGSASFPAGTVFNY